MVNIIDKLNSPRALIITLVLFAIVNGFLFYCYQQLTTGAAADLPRATTERSAATLPPESVSPSDSGEDGEEDGAGGEQEEEAGMMEGGDDKADSPASEEKVGPEDVAPEAQETGPEQAPAPTPYPPSDPAQPLEEPAPVAAEEPAVSPAPLPAPAYPEPV